YNTSIIKQQQHTKTTLFPYTTLFRSHYYIAVNDRSFDAEEYLNQIGVKTITNNNSNNEKENNTNNSNNNSNVENNTTNNSTNNTDRKSTRLNSSHVSISYAVFCLKKK